MKNLRKKEKLISVIVPVYNVEEYLPKCIISILRQTYKNLEIILIDDGSVDNSGTICDAYAERDQRILVKHLKNRGVSVALNEALKLAKGEYITFVDSDDWLERDSYAYAVEKMETDSDIDAVVYNYFTVWTKNMRARYIEAPFCLNKKEAIEVLVENSWMKNYRWNKVYKRKVFFDVCYPEGAIFEDIPVTYRLFLKCEKIYVSEKIKYYYRMRKGSYVHTTTYYDYLDYCLGHQKRYGDLIEIYPELNELLLTKYLEVFDEMLKRKEQAINTDDERFETIINFFQSKKKIIEELELLQKNTFKNIDLMLQKGTL